MEHIKLFRMSFSTINTVVLNIYIVAFVISMAAGIFCVENSDNVIFNFPEYDYKETSKNVSVRFIDFSCLH